MGDQKHRWVQVAESILSQYSVIIRLARPNDTRKHCRPLVCCSAAVLQTAGQDQLVLETDGGGLCSDLGPCSTEGGEVAVILVQCTGSIRCLHCSRQHLAISPPGHGVRVRGVLLLQHLSTIFLLPLYPMILVL